MDSTQIRTTELWQTSVSSYLCLYYSVYSCGRVVSHQKQQICIYIYARRECSIAGAHRVGGIILLAEGKMKDGWHDSFLLHSKTIFKILCFLFLNITLSLGFSFENFFILQVENSLLIEMSALTTFPPLFISTVNGIFLYKALIKIKQRAVGVSSWLQVFLKSTCVKLHLIFFLDLNNQNRSLYSGYTS